MQDRNRIEGDETEAQLRRTETPEHLRGATADVTQVNEAERRLAADLDAMTRLQRLGTLSVREGELAPVLEEIVEAAIAIAEADFGNIQLLDPSSGELRIAAQRGFPPWWVAFWDRVPAGRGACGTALAQGGRVIVEDIETSPLFRETPALEIQRRAGVRAVQSPTLRSRSGETIGVFSTTGDRTAPTRGP
jgi:GAF domain-containing protein